MTTNKVSFSKLNPTAMALAFGIIAGIMVLISGLLLHAFLAGKPIVAAIGTMYISYNPTLINSVLCGVVSFVNVCIGVYIAIWLYNFLVDSL